MRLEDELRRALREEVSGVGSSEEAWRSIERRLERRTPRRRGSRVAAIALAFTLSTVSLVGLWLGFRSGGMGREITSGEPPDLQPRVTAVVPVGPFPQDVAVGEGAVWVSVPAQEPDEDDLIVRVDPATNEVVARIPVEDPLDDLAAGEGGVWGVGADGSGADLTLYVGRIDPVTNEVVARIPDVSGPLAIGEGSLWAVDRAGARAGPEGSSLLRIDPATNEVEATIPLGVAAWDIEIGEGYVWILPLEPGPGEGNILQVDPATNELVARIEIPIPGTVFAPAVGEGSAWVPVCCVDNELTLVRVDVGTSEIVGEPVMVDGGAPFAVVAGHVWMFDERGTLFGLNTTTLEVDQEVSGMGPVGVFPDPSAELDPAQLVVWIANYRDSVTRIDLASSGTPSAEPEPAAISAPEGKLLLQTPGRAPGRVEVLDEDGVRKVLGDDLVALDLSPDGSTALLTTYGNGAELLTLDIATGERSTIATTRATAYPARWSPDGSKIAYRENNTLCLVDVVSGSNACMPELGRVYTFDWAPDSHRMVLGLATPEPLTVFDVASGQATPLVPWDDPAVLQALEEVGFGRATRVQFEGPKWSASGRYIATLAMVFETVGGTDGKMVLVFNAAGDLVARGRPGGLFWDARAWSPISDVFAYGWGGDQTVEVRTLDPATGDDVSAFSTEATGRGTLRDLAWSPSGVWMAIVAETHVDTYGWRISIVDMTTQEGIRTMDFPDVSLADWGR